MEITVKINGQAVSVDVTIEVYECIQGFDRKAENLMHQKRRHWDMRELDEYIIANECSRVHTLTPEQILCRQETLNQILSALRACTETQQKRFLLYALEDMSYKDIARLQGCSKVAVHYSIQAVRKKYQELSK